MLVTCALRSRESTPSRWHLLARLLLARARRAAAPHAILSLPPSSGYCSTPQRTGEADKIHCAVFSIRVHCSLEASRPVVPTLVPCVLCAGSSSPTSGRTTTGGRHCSLSRCAATTPFTTSSRSSGKLQASSQANNILSRCFLTRCLLVVVCTAVLRSLPHVAVSVTESVSWSAV